MPYLVEVLHPSDGHDAAEGLSEAFVRIAAELLTPGEGRAAPSRFDELRERLDRRKVDVPDWRDPVRPIVVNGGRWDRGEVETNLRQIEVIVLALRSSILAGSASVRVSPTQQGGFDAVGIRDGRPWALEAFGGSNVNNNNKLVEDGASLARAASGTLRLFACRPAAWRGRSYTRAVSSGSFELINTPDVDHVLLFEFTPLDVTPASASTT